MKFEEYIEIVSMSEPPDADPDWVLTSSMMELSGAVGELGTRVSRKLHNGWMIPHEDVYTLVEPVVYNLSRLMKQFGVTMDGVLERSVKRRGLHGKK